jgi:hypothetical protein
MSLTPKTNFFTFCFLPAGYYFDIAFFKAFRQSPCGLFFCPKITAKCPYSFWDILQWFFSWLLTLKYYNINSFVTILKTLFTFFLAYLPTLVNKGASYCFGKTIRQMPMRHRSREIYLFYIKNSTFSFLLFVFLLIFLSYQFFLYLISIYQNLYILTQNMFTVFFCL